ncbi:unnamed protein product [Brassicogethes aeneus]|uniref:DUF4200 domain-containing protein n=1 Tax=Brassicogethes aeneus TaxID=1431903 RepID=A0A9P0BES8_BRAAE|nr:unnamed protein product [Brassicogethes aeneus]
MQLQVEVIHQKPLYNYVLDYIKSKNFEVVLSKYHEKSNTIRCGDPHILIEHYKEKLRKIEKQLAKARKNKAQEQTKIMAEYASFEVKETALRKNFFRFNKFIKENGEKRERGAIKMKEEKEAIKKWEEKTNHLKGLLDKLESIKNVIDDAIRKHKIYENFFMKCCGDIFKQPGEIVERYELLLETRHTLLERQNNILMTLENFKTDLMRETEAAKLVILGLNTRIFNLQERYENSRYKSTVNENIIVDIYGVAGEKLEEITETKLTVNEMFMSINKTDEIVR